MKQNRFLMRMKRKAWILDITSSLQLNFPIHMAACLSVRAETAVNAGSTEILAAAAAAAVDDNDSVQKKLLPQASSFSSSHPNLYYVGRISSLNACQSKFHVSQEKTVILTK